MPTYVIRRLVALIPTLFFASLIVFVTVRLIPGSAHLKAQARRRNPFGRLTTNLGFQVKLEGRGHDRRIAWMTLQNGQTSV